MKSSDEIDPINIDPAAMAQAALDVQMATNCGGITNTLAALMPVLSAWDREHGNRGTAWRNQHPIVVLYLDALADLARMDHFGNHYRWAHDWATRQVSSGTAATLEYIPRDS